MRTNLSESMRAALLVAIAAAVAAPAADAKTPARRSELKTRESLRQSFDGRAGRREDGRPVRERRRLRATLTATLPIPDFNSLGGRDLFGLRIGDWKFEQPLSSARKWRWGKRHASFRVESEDADVPGATTIRAKWTRGTLHVDVVSTCKAPIAEAGVVLAKAGPVTSSIDGAVRLGDTSAHLGGTATGEFAVKVLPTDGPSVDLARVELVGSADVVDATNDARAPVVTVSRPAVGSQCDPGTIVVEGAVRDDRALPSISWSIDGGAVTDTLAVADPTSGFLDDVRGTYSFVVPVTSGVHTLLVVATDLAGNESTATFEFNVRFPPPIEEPPKDPPVDPVDEGPVPAPASDEILLLGMSKWGATCVDEQGRVQAWGYNTTTPTIVPGVAGVQSAEGNLALLADGTVTTLHGNPYGNSTSNAPMPIADLADVVGIAQCSTNSASFAVKADGSVWAFGDDSTGQMGDGGGTSKYPPVQVPGLPAIKSVSAGGWHALALDRQGGVWTWGDRNAPTGAAAIRPHRVAGVANAVVISASEFDRFATGAAVLADGTLWMWGDATSGQLGGSVASRETPAFQVEGVTGARSVSMGYNHALVLLNDGTVIARGSPTSEVWGYWGELGDGTLTPHIEFAPVPGLSGVVQLATGAHTSSVLMQDGTIRAWGQNTFGTVGDGTKTDALSPVVVRLSK